ncbi:MAG: uracil-DNA glycosylase family protein [Anaerolineaceae bacterium]
MKINQLISCDGFPCPGMKHGSYTIPEIEINPETITAVMIAEASPHDPADGFYAAGDPLYLRTTLQAFQDAGLHLSNVQEILDLGFYLTTAVKCGKKGYEIDPRTIKECSLLLEKELAVFPNVKVILLMGDTAIKAMNYIAQRAGGKRVIPAGSTYKIRSADYSYLGMRVIPSYLQAGPSYFIERTKRKVIAEDIARAVSLVRSSKGFAL